MKPDGVPRGCFGLFRNTATEIAAMTMKKTLSALSLIAVLGAAPRLSACHTAAGAAEDVGAAGRAVNRGAQNTENAIRRNTP